MGNWCGSFGFSPDPQVYFLPLPRQCWSASANLCLTLVFPESVIAQAAVTVFAVAMEPKCK